MSFQKSLDKKQPAGLDFIISCLALDKCLNVYGYASFLLSENNIVRFC